MTTKNFKAGDVVRCVDNAAAEPFLYKGVSYTVAEDMGERGLLRLKGVDFPFDTCRFELAAPGDVPGPPPGPTCKTCIYGNVQQDGSGIQCRRHSPTAIQGRVILTKAGKYATSDVSWPVMDAADWCGDHPDMPAWIARQRPADKTFTNPTPKEVPASVNIALTSGMLKANLRTQTRSVLIDAGLWPQGFGKRPAGDPRKLLEMTRDDLLELRNCGPATVKDIVTYLARFGMRLAE